MVASTKTGCGVSGCTSHARPIFCGPHSCRIKFCLRPSHTTGPKRITCAHHAAINTAKEAAIFNKTLTLMYKTATKVEGLTVSERRLEKAAWLQGIWEQLGYQQEAMPKESYKVPTPKESNGPEDIRPSPAIVVSNVVIPPITNLASTPSSGTSRRREGGDETTKTAYRTLTFQARRGLSRSMRSSSDDEDSDDSGGDKDEPPADEPHAKAKSPAKQMPPTMYGSVRANRHNRRWAFPGNNGQPPVVLTLSSTIDPTDSRYEFTPRIGHTTVREIDWTKTSDPDKPFYTRPSNQRFSPVSSPSAPFIAGDKGAPYLSVFNETRADWEAGTITPKQLRLALAKSTFLVPPWTPGSGLRGNYPRYVNHKSCNNPLGCQHKGHHGPCVIRKVPVTLQELFDYNTRGDTGSYPCLSPLMGFQGRIDDDALRKLVGKIVLVDVCFGPMPSGAGRGWLEMPTNNHTVVRESMHSPFNRVQDFIMRMGMVIGPYTCKTNTYEAIKRNHCIWVSGSCYCNGRITREDKNGVYPVNPYKRVKHAFIMFGGRGSKCQLCARTKQKQDTEYEICKATCERVAPCCLVYRQINDEWRQEYVDTRNTLVDKQNAAEAKRMSNILANLTEDERVDLSIYRDALEDYLQGQCMQSSS